MSRSSAHKTFSQANVFMCIKKVLDSSVKITLLITLHTVKTEMLRAPEMALFSLPFLYFKIEALQFYPDGVLILTTVKRNQGNKTAQYFEALVL